MIEIGSVADNSDHIKDELFRVIKMRKKFPTKGNSGCLDAKCGNNVFNLRGRRDGENIKEKEKSEDGNQKDAVAKEKNNERYSNPHQLFLKKKILAHKRVHRHKTRPKQWNHRQKKWPIN